MRDHRQKSLDLMYADKLFHKPGLTKLPGLKFEADKKDDDSKMAENLEEMKPENFKIHILDKFDGFRKFYRLHTFLILDRPLLWSV